MFSEDVSAAAKAIAFAAGCILLSPATGAAQKTVAIAEDLSANAIVLKVKMGTQWPGRVAKWRFGDYAVGSSKAGAVKSKEKSNLLGTRGQTSGSQRFSFVMKGPTPETAKVDAVHAAGAEISQSVPITGFITLGNDELIEATDLLSASISFSDDPADAWTMLRIVKAAQQEEDDLWEFYLTNGRRKLLIEGVESRLSDGSPDPNPAAGYEISEDGKSLAALQINPLKWYQGVPSWFVYLRQDLEPRMKLLLAAAMTVILHASTTGF
jgi:hypothetical protein